jgi:hypothetical protein
MRPETRGCEAFDLFKADEESWVLCGFVDFDFDPDSDFEPDKTQTEPLDPWPFRKRASSRADRRT